MRISSVTVFRVCIPFRNSFGHALYWRHKTETLIICVASDSGLAGYGEILPRDYLTGETFNSIFARHLPDLVRRWQDRSFNNHQEVTDALRQERYRDPRALATLAGWELAILDLAGKIFGFAVGELLGGIIWPEPHSSPVIGFEVPTDKMEMRCVLLRLKGAHYIKVKVGRPDDLRRLQTARAVFGPDVPIRVDANAAWSAHNAIAALLPMQRLNISSVEQPVAARDLDGMREVRQRTGMTVVADESLCSLSDAYSILKARAADVFNIRIGKCGGLLASMDLVALAKEAGLSCQLGTLVGETGILSRAAEIFAERVPGFEFLEGKKQNRQLLLEDIVQHGGVALPATSGLGLQIAPESLAKWAASTTTFSEIPQGVKHANCE
jgi:L-Ala-D/L-Glu epimerase